MICIADISKKEDKFWLMLQVMRIKNLAVIEYLTWELSPGFNIITGETGAGKSILIDALSLLLGERADRELIRDGAESCTVEAGLEVTRDLSALLDELGLEQGEGNQVLLRRTFSQQGQGRQFVNGSPTTLQSLKKLGRELVDIHGPHDHQSLLDVDEQRVALDSFAKAGGALASYQKLFSERQNLLRELKDLTQTGSEGWQQRIDYLAYQIQDIETADLRPGEEEQVDSDYSVAANAQRIVELGNDIRGILEEGDSDIMGQLAQVQRQLQEWQKFDPKAASLVELNSGVVAQLQELLREIEEKVGQTELDGERLSQLEKRLNRIQDLKKKYGPNISAILEKLSSFKAEREKLESREGRIQELEAQVEKVIRLLQENAKGLTSLRKEFAPKLSAAITKELHQLGFKKAEFQIQVSAVEELLDSGQDRIEYLFAPNIGEAARPLRGIASSGEMARVMLAVKTVLAAQDEVPVLVFDEIDANVGGETAVVVGKKLRSLAKNHQVLCITHLPQVAAAGHDHYRVEKKIEGGRTFTRLNRLSEKDRVDELSRMLGGKKASAEALSRELLAEGKR